MAKTSLREKMSFLSMQAIIIGVALVLVFFAAGARFGAYLSAGADVDIAENTQIVIDVKGAVEKSGLYSLPQNSRVADLLEIVPLHEDAAPELLNAAAFLLDGSELIVPSATEEATDWNALAAARGSVYYGNDTSETAITTADIGIININTAASQELQKLSGIGPAKAQNIIDYRENYGPFLTIEQIMNVSGIGSATFDKIKEHISVE